MLMNTFGRLFALILTLSVVHPSSIVVGQSAEYLPGLVSHMTLADGSLARRVDAMCDWQWEDPHHYDPRLTTDQACKIRWTGALNVKTSGKYQLAIRVQGEARAQLDSLSIIDGRSEDPTVHKSSERELTVGYHPLEVLYEGKQPGGQLKLYWRGPGFQWEPVTERYLVHEAEQHPSDDFERGRLLARGLRCHACHGPADGSTIQAPLSAPDLTSLAGNLQREWLVNWLLAESPEVKVDPELRDDEISRRMPHLGLKLQDAVDISQALFDASKEVADFKPTRDFENKANKPKGKDKNPPRTKPDAQEGRTILLSRGCVACHALSTQEIGLRDEDDEANYTQPARQDYLMHKLFAGSDLSGIAAKRPADFFSRWLAKPDTINPSHRMPEASLTDLEREDISLYLASLKPESVGTNDRPTGNAKRGAELIRQHRCAACHAMPQVLAEKPAKKIELGADSHWDNGCLGAADSSKSLPGFELTSGQRKSLKVYWMMAVRDTKSHDEVASRSNAEMLMAESNCFACHARQNHNGLVSRAMQVIEKDRGLAARLPAMLPPSLNGVGDKLHDAALADAIARKETPHRPWLDVRMPKYPFQETQVEAIVATFVASDRLPVMDDGTKTKLADDVVTRSAAGRLVTSEGFGCQSCHQIGKQPSPTVALGARGTDLTMLGGRIRQSWFDRWVRNPIRIIPRMEMPAIQLPVHGVLGNDLNRQIDAVWEMLNTPEFQPPTPAPVRVVRKHNLPGQTEPAHVLTDVLETNERNYLRPLIVGFQNRHNVLFDLERGEVGKWWIGDTARELTRGKSWYWELGGQPLGAKLESLVRFQLMDAAGAAWKPHALEQFVVDFDELDHSSNGITFKARMYFTKDERRLTVPIEVTMLPTNQPDSSGVDMTFRFSSPANYHVVVHIGQADSQWERNSAGPWMNVDDHTLIAFPDWSSRYGLEAGNAVTVSAPTAAEPVAVGIRLFTTWPVDQFVESSTPPTATGASTVPNSATNTAGSAPSRPAPVAIKIVPGFTGVQLPLPRNEMPTALAWHQGQLVIGSLKGRVCIARDSDQDGLEETWEPISDDVPAPYGLASNGNFVDVLSKYGLVRLSPPAVAEAPWKMQVVADGWGYTADYHDWAVGLVGDSQNNYVMALPCQQDDRTPSAARLRGTVQRLIPQTPTSSDPRQYRLETIAGGQRFPMGLAIDRAGRLFATDNQGNYNPFNEVNHIQEGKRYGFINKLENKPGFNPPLESPAVNLPHPWTRSVNGICFLNTPVDYPTANLFGPYEGHLIGCEYNGLSLIRMSFEEVDGVMQGAAYMFSRSVTEGESTFEGPVVCNVSPAGELVVGNIHDSGWGGGQNTGSIVRLKPSGTWQLGIAEVKALKEGLRIVFTGTVDEAAAKKVSSYTIRSYRRVSTPAYGGNDQEERQEPVLSVNVVGGGSMVDLTLNPLRADAVYEVRVSLPGDQPLFPDEAHYTMKRIPK